MSGTDSKQRIFAALPGSVDQIVERSGLAHTTVRRWLYRMCDAGEAHLNETIPCLGGGPSTAYYVAGEYVAEPVNVVPTEPVTWLTPLFMKDAA